MYTTTTKDNIFLQKELVNSTDYMYFFEVESYETHKKHMQWT